MVIIALILHIDKKIFTVYSEYKTVVDRAGVGIVDTDGILTTNYHLLTIFCRLHWPLPG